MGTLNSSILRLNEAVPLGPARVLILYVPLLVGIPVLEAYQLVEVSQHIYKHSYVGLSLQEVLQCELDAIFRFEEIYHLTNDVLEIKI